MRPGPHEKELPSQLFWWQAPDGSRVLTFRIAAAYTTRTIDHAAHIMQAIEAKPAQLSHTMCFLVWATTAAAPPRNRSKT